MADARLTLVSWGHHMQKNGYLVDANHLGRFWDQRTNQLKLAAAWNGVIGAQAQTARRNDQYIASPSAYTAKLLLESLRVLEHTIDIAEQEQKLTAKELGVTGDLFDAYIKHLIDNCYAYTNQVAQELEENFTHVKRNPNITAEAGANRPAAASATKDGANAMASPPFNNTNEFVVTAARNAAPIFIEHMWFQFMNQHTPTFHKRLVQRACLLRLVPKSLRAREPGWQETIQDEVLREEKVQLRAAWHQTLAQMKDRGRPPAAIDLVKAQLNESLAQSERLRFPTWPPGDRRNEENTRVSAEIIDAIFGMGDAFHRANTTWEFIGVLGSGGFGTASLHTQYDEHGNVVDRIVIKDVHIPNGDWGRGSRWDEVDGSSAPTEVTLHNKIPGHTSIVGLRCCAVHRTVSLVRIYLDFCDLGDLNDLISEHLKLKQIYEEEGIVNREWQIPPSAVWAFFYWLICACCMLHDGRLPDDPANTEFDNMSVVHLDLKPRNIFVTQPVFGNEFFRSIPVLRLGDFGLAKDVGKPEPKHNTGFHKEGTTGWMAPEQVQKPGSWTDFAITSKTNIWAIGLVMLTVMNCDIRTRTDQVINEHYVIPRFRTDARRLYPTNLQVLANWCLAHDPDDRPYPSELYREFKKMAAAVSRVPNEPGGIPVEFNNIDEGFCLLPNMDKRDWGLAA